MRQPGEFVFVHERDCPGIVLFALDEKDGSYCVLLVPRTGPLRVAEVEAAQLNINPAIGEEMQLVIGARLGARMRSPFGEIA